MLFRPTVTHTRSRTLKLKLKPFTHNNNLFTDGTEKKKMYEKNRDKTAENMAHKNSFAHQSKLQIYGKHKLNRTHSGQSNTNYFNQRSNHKSER